MGYAQALLGKDTAEERRRLEEQSAKKGLYGSVGRTLGGIAAMAVTGGMASPFLAALTTAGMTAAGGAIGSNQQKISGGQFYQSERGALKSKLGGFGSENLVGSLTAGLTAGTTQALSQTKAVGEAKELFQTQELAAGRTPSMAQIKEAGRAAKIQGLDFGGSFIGGSSGLQAGKTLASQMRSAATVEGLPEGMSRFDYFNLMRSRQAGKVSPTGSFGSS